MKPQDKLILRWPSTGELEATFHGNDSATLRFTPSPWAIEDAVGTTPPEAVYADLRDGHPITHPSETKAFCAFSGGSGPLPGFTITDHGAIIVNKGKPRDLGENTMTEDTKMETGELCGYEVYAARYNQHLRSGELGRCGEDLYLMAAVLRDEGRRLDELKALMLSYYFDLNGLGSGPAVNRNTAKWAADAVISTCITKHEMEELYLLTISKDTLPFPIMSVRDSLYIFEIALDGRYDEADGLLGRFTGSTNR